MPLVRIESRIEAFSDAVFGFAATLLVVSLEVPKSFSRLLEQLDGFFSFGLSFFALVMIWVVHNNFFRRVRKIDNWILAFNMILLFVILFFVFPLKFLTGMMFERVYLSISEFSQLFQLYSLGFSLVFLAFCLMYFKAATIEESPERKGMLFFYSRHFGIFVFMGLVSIVLAYLRLGLSIGVPGIIYALLGPLCFFHGRWFGFTLEENNP